MGMERQDKPGRLQPSSKIFFHSPLGIKRETSFAIPKDPQIDVMFLRLAWNSLCSTGWLWTHCYLPASDSWVLGTGLSLSCPTLGCSFLTELHSKVKTSCISHLCFAQARLWPHPGLGVQPNTNVLPRLRSWNLGIVTESGFLSWLQGWENKWNGMFRQI